MGVLVAITSSPHTGAAPRWIPVSVATSGDRTFVELNSLERRGDTAWYWVLNKYPKLKPDGLAAIQGY